MTDHIPNLKIRTKIDVHEFGAEGPVDSVQAHFAAFLQAIGRAREDAKETPPPPPAMAARPDFQSLFRVDGSIVSLNNGGESVDRDIRLLLLGQKQLRNKDSVTGTEIMAGLRASGHDYPRADHVLKRHARSGDIVVTGKRRSCTYRLTTDGFDKAVKIAVDHLGKESLKSKK